MEDIMLILNRANLERVNHVAYSRKTGKLRYAIVNDDASWDEIHRVNIGEELVPKPKINLSGPFSIRGAQRIVRFIGVFTGIRFRQHYQNDDSVTEDHALFLRNDLVRQASKKHEWKFSTNATVPD